MELFSPDKFSAVKTNWQEANHTEMTLAVEVAKHFVPRNSNFHQVENCFRSATAFKVKMGESDYIIKSNPAPFTSQQIKAQVHFCETIFTSPFNFSKNLKAGNEYFYEADNKLWTMEYFIEGKLFSESNGQLENILCILSTFFCELKSVKTSQRLPVRPTLKDKINSSANVEHELFRMPIFLPEVRNVVDDFIKTDFKRELGRETVYGPTHCDIHPHNLIFNEAQNSFFLIDKNSVVLSDQITSAAYGAFKLTRQEISKNGNYQSSVNFLKHYFETLFMDGAATGATYELIEILILSEIISRIQNIDQQPENQLSENQNLAKMLCANYWETRFLFKEMVKT